MKKKVGLELDVEVEGSKELAETELRLKEIAAALREAAKAGDTDTYAKLRQEQLKLQESSKGLRKEIRDQVKDFNTAELPTDSILALRRQYIALKKELLELSATDANFDRKAAQAKDLNDEIKRLEASLGDTRRNVGNYQEAVENALGNVQNAIGGNISALIAGLGAGGAVIGGIDLVQQGLNEIVNIASEVIEVRGRIQQLTGLTGDTLESAAAQAQAVAQTYGKDVDELLVAINNAAEGFGVTFEEALNAFETGVLAGADANGQLLDQFTEYPTLINNAGGSLEDFIKLATAQQTEGIYNDKLIDTIKELDLSLRELTETQIKALEPLGEDFVNKLSEDLRTGAVSSLDALKAISEQAKEQGLDLQQLQTITADVFKGAGEDAGGYQKVVETVFTALESDYDSLIDKNNQFVQAQIRTREANQALAEASGELANELGGTGATLSTLSTTLRARFLQGLVDAIRNTREFFSFLQPLGDALVRLGKNLGLGSNALEILSKVSKVFNFQFRIVRVVLESVAQYLTFFINRISATIEGIRGVGRAIGLIRKQEEKAQDTVIKQQANVRKTTEEFLGTMDKLGDKTKETADKTKDLGDESEKTGDKIEKLNNVADKVAKTGIAAMEAQVAKLNEQLLSAQSKEAYAQTQLAIDNLQTKIKATREEYEKFAEVQRLLRDAPAQQASDREQFTGQGIGQIEGPTQAPVSDAATSPEVERERLIAQYKKDIAQDVADFSEDIRQRELESEEEAQQSRVALIQDAGQRIGQTLGQLAADSEITLQDFSKAAALIALDAAEQVVNLAIAELFAKQVASAGFLGVAKASILTGVIKGFTSAIFGVIRNNIGEFAEGGAIGQTRPGIIRNRPNVRPTKKGDNVLIVAKRGEMVLNERQQRIARAMYGEDIWKQLGIPGFNTGGLVRTVPQLVAPVSGQNGTTLSLEPDQIQELARQIATQTAQETARETASSVAQAILVSNERQSRLDNLRKTRVR